MKKTIEITNGPSREELFDGLRLFNEKRLIPFCIRVDETEKFVAVIINSIQAEDGSGQSWNLNFYINQKFVSGYFSSDKVEKNEKYVYSKKITFETFRRFAEEKYLLGEYEKNQILVKVYYSTKTRKGVITIE